jgi:hypothetical protein
MLSFRELPKLCLERSPGLAGAFQSSPTWIWNFAKLPKSFQEPIKTSSSLGNSPERTWGFLEPPGAIEGPFPERPLEHPRGSRTPGRPGAPRSQSGASRGPRSRLGSSQSSPQKFLELEQAPDASGACPGSSWRSSARLSGESRELPARCFPETFPKPFRTTTVKTAPADWAEPLE